MAHLNHVFDFHILGDKSLYLVIVTVLARNKKSRTRKSILVQCGTTQEAIEFVASLYPRSQLCTFLAVDEIYNV